jgi:CHAT domain-containing protein
MKSTIRILLAVGIMFLHCAAAHAAVGDSLSSTQQKLLELAVQIRALGQDGKANPKNDARVIKLYGKGERLWQKSPANSRTTISAIDPVYEFNIITQAMVVYFQLTGRPGKYLPYLQLASKESKQLRYYDDWRTLELQLVSNYRRLGMLDHAAAGLNGLLKFMQRLGFSLDELPPKMNRDAVVFIQLHALRLDVSPDDYTDATVVQRLFDYYLRTVDETPQSWGWQPNTGWSYADFAIPFVRWAAHYDPVQLDARIAHYKAIRQSNIDVDPLALADERALNHISSTLGRDIFAVLNTPFSQFTQFSNGIQAQEKKYWRYLSKSRFQQELDLAEVFLLLGDYESSLQQANKAEQRLKEVYRFYQDIPADFVAQDKLPLLSIRLKKVTARSLEGLGQLAEAEVLYREYILWSEKERASLSLEERLHFFRGQAREAYLGRIRVLAKMQQASTDSANTEMEVLLNAIEQLKARQFLESLGGTDVTAPSPLTLQLILARLASNAGILLFQDTGDALLSILITAHKQQLQYLKKDASWDAHVMLLRNKLAQAATYDRESFQQLGEQVLGFAAADITPLQQLLVITDGILSAIPPSILPINDQALLDDGRYLSQIPSLNIWLDGNTAIDERQPKLFVLADPVFKKPKQVKAHFSRDLLATRGSTALDYFTPLPETREEGQSILARFPIDSDSNIITGTKASESAVKNTPLAAYTHLHFATHGVISNDLPGITEPALVLAYEEDEDGFLLASEVSALKLNARLTVLSACNTGNGEYFNGEGLMGMGRAFLLAGSKSVIVSLWPVESFSTQKIMELLYYYLAEGMPPAEALWRAQRTVREGSGAEAGLNRGLQLNASIAAGMPPAEALWQAQSTVRDGSDAEAGINRGLQLNASIAAGKNSNKIYENPYYWSPFVLISTE